jgi:uncharacterized membrane protein YagU involved in acid resistance
MSELIALTIDGQSELGNLIHRHGGEFVAFVGAGVQVALPRRDREFVQALAEEGLKLLPGSIHRRPVQMANPPADLLHDSPGFPGQFSFWKLAEFVSVL